MRCHAKLRQFRATDPLACFWLALKQWKSYLRNLEVWARALASFTERMRNLALSRSGPKNFLQMLAPHPHCGVLAQKARYVKIHPKSELRNPQILARALYFCKQLGFLSTIFCLTPPVYCLTSTCQLPAEARRISGLIVGKLDPTH